MENRTSNSVGHCGSFCCVGAWIHPESEGKCPKQKKEPHGSRKVGTWLSSNPRPKKEKPAWIVLPRKTARTQTAFQKSGWTVPNARNASVIPNGAASGLSCGARLAGLLKVRHKFLNDLYHLLWQNRLESPSPKAPARFPFLAMAPWESVPSAREVVAQLQACRAETD